MSGQVTILGAGAMGSALATPFRACAWPVHLWGTWLDDHLLDVTESGGPHPRTGVRLAAGTRTFRADGLAEALAGARLVVLAVASVGVMEVMARALPYISGADALLVTSKGFSPDEAGRIRLLPDAIRELAAQRDIALPPIVAVGGPCKANEVAASRWTASVFASRDRGVAEDAAKGVATGVYRAEVSDDESGVEICAPMKNVYAIALGIADGVGERDGTPAHDLKAATFAQAATELQILARVVGGRPETAVGLAGIGDLEVTGLSGRNKVYGARVGRGESPSGALAAMAAAEQTVEGVPAADLARQLVDQRAPERWPELPLLRTVLDVLDDARDPEELLAAAVLPR